MDQLVFDQFLSKQFIQGISFSFRVCFLSCKLLSKVEKSRDATDGAVLDGQAVSGFQSW